MIQVYCCLKKEKASNLQSATLPIRYKNSLYISSAKSQILAEFVDYNHKI